MQADSQAGVQNLIAIGGIGGNDRDGAGNLNAANNTLATANTVSQTTLFSTLLAFQELASRLSSQVHAAHDEIGETRAILKDAIGRLIPAFTETLEGRSAAHAPGGLAESGGTATPTFERTDATERSATQNAAFNALQFQDISDQLLAHAQCRLMALTTELALITRALEPTRVIKTEVVLPSLLRHLELVNDNLAKLDLSLSKPVSKAHLGVGDMEMF